LLHTKDKKEAEQQHTSRLKHSTIPHSTLLSHTKKHTIYSATMIRSACYKASAMAVFLLVATLSLAAATESIEATTTLPSTRLRGNKNNIISNGSNNNEDSPSSPNTNENPSSSLSRRSLSSVVSDRDGNRLYNNNNGNGNQASGETTRKRPLPVSPGIAEGVEFGDLPCLLAAVCEQADLGILCGFLTSRLSLWMPSISSTNNGNGNGNAENNAWMGNKGTFFGPLDSAFSDTAGFSLMTNILTEDLANATILENVLSYHAAKPTRSSSFVRAELACNKELAMANGLSTHTICLDGKEGSEKFQSGIGNRPMRTLPGVTDGVEACDGNAYIYFVDELILPPLPLEGMPEPPPTEATPEDDQGNNNDNDEGIAPATNTTITIPSIPTPPTLFFSCPKNRPTPGDACTIEDYHNNQDGCNYGYTYHGCSWERLSCVPVTTCACTGGHTGSSWQCSVRDVRPCPATNEDNNELSLEELPRGYCNPKEELPQNPSGSNTDTTTNIDNQNEAPACPDDPPVAPGRCSPGDVTTSCNYDYVYTGCTEETLVCTPIQSCSCGNDGMWICALATITPCGTFNIRDKSVVEGPPEGLPWGQSCTPESNVKNETGSNDVFLLPPPRNDTKKVVPSSSSLCPASKPLAFSSCLETSQAGATCEYGHMYTGCNQEELACSWTRRCACGSDGNWTCAMTTIAPCGSFDEDSNWVQDDLPEGFPRGQSCMPDDELPVLSMVTDSDGNSNSNSNTAVDGRLEDECPPEAPIGQACGSYVPNLRCPYNHIYTGCTWEQLSCTAIVQCTCGVGDGSWACMSMAMMPCADPPEGLPVGLYCDPAGELPSASAAAPTGATTQASTAAVARARTGEPPLVADVVGSWIP